MLRLEGVFAGHGRSVVLHGVSLELVPGEILAGHGANGAAKSTLVRTIAGLVNASSGSVLLDGMKVNKLRPNRRLRMGIAFVREGQQSFPGMTVYEKRQVGAASQVKARAEVAKRLEPIFELFPRRAERGKQMAGPLSGGERQMLAIGRALVSHPRSLILDEPSHRLSPIACRPSSSSSCLIGSARLPALSPSWWWNTT
jgi:ABC-type branched-subunit amino acid transport system ATPase component